MTTYEINLSALEDVSDAIRLELEQQHATRKEIERTLLLLEEVAVKYQMCMPEAKVHARVARSFRTLYVRLSAAGADRNPIAETETWSAETEDYYRTLILRANRALLNYQRMNGENVVTILVHTQEKQYMRYSLVGILGGLVLGAILHWAVPSGVSEWIDWNIFSVFQTLFLNAISLMAVPAVFCSVVSSITSLSSVADTGRIGTRVMGLYSLTTILAILVGFALAIPAFSMQLLDLGIAGSTEVLQSSVFNLRGFLTDLVPENLLAPFLDGDILQVLLIAALTGTAIGMLGHRAEPIRVFIAACDKVFQTIIAIVALLVPVLTFISMASLMLRFGAHILPTILVLFLVEFAGCWIMMLLYAVLVRLIGGIPAKPFLRKVIRYFRRLSPQASSGEYLPKVVQLCTGQLGVSDRVASFSASLGAAVNMDGSALHLVICGVLMVQGFSGAINTQAILTIAFVAFILSAGAAAVQNSGMVAVSSMATTLGAPATAIGLLFGVDQVLDLSHTASNAIGDAAVCVIVGQMENELDRTEYMKP